ncbi:MAG TPA: hypothetical protein VGD43_22505, partial [Micromonospora sp.]
MAPRSTGAPVDTPNSSRIDRFRSLINRSSPTRTGSARRAVDGTRRHQPSGQGGHTPGARFVPGTGEFRPAGGASQRGGAGPGRAGGRHLSDEEETLMRDLATEFEAERDHLMAVAYRMLGSRAEA